MKHRFNHPFQRSILLPAVSIVTLAVLSLLGTGCSMSEVLPPTSTPTKTPKATTAVATQETGQAAPATVAPLAVTTVATQETVGVTPSVITTVTVQGTVQAAPLTVTLVSTLQTGKAVSVTATLFISPTPSATTAAPAAPTPTEEVVVMPARAEGVNPLTGLTVADKTVLQRRPILVRIGNDPQIRPQSGLSRADLVYEDIMDGWWITRLTGIYLSQDLEAVGPVRSARLVNLQMAPQFDGGLVHSGASDPIRWRLSKSDIADLDEFFNREPYFYKQGADWRGRLFVNLKVLRAYLTKKGLEKAVPLRGFVFDTATTPPPAGLPATELTIPYPKNSVVRFKYDTASGLYQRFVQGQPHLDAVTNKQLAASNVVIQFCPHENTDIVEDSLGTTSINIVLVGEGKALVFRDGVVTEGTWKCTNPKQMTRFLDNKGQFISFKPGQTWIELVPPEYQIGPLGGTAAVTATLTTTVTAPAKAPVTAPTTAPTGVTGAAPATAPVSATLTTAAPTIVSTTTVKPTEPPVATPVTSATPVVATPTVFFRGPGGTPSKH